MSIKRIPLNLLEADDDDLIKELLASNPAFRVMVEKSKAGPRKPFRLGSEA